MSATADATRAAGQAPCLQAQPARQKASIWPCPSILPAARPSLDSLQGDLW